MVSSYFGILMGIGKHLVKAKPKEEEVKIVQPKGEKPYLEIGAKYKPVRPDWLSPFDYNLYDYTVEILDMKEGWVQYRAIGNGKSNLKLSLSEDDFKLIFKTKV